MKPADRNRFLPGGLVYLMTGFETLVAAREPGYELICVIVVPGSTRPSVLSTLHPGDVPIVLGRALGVVTAAVGGEEGGG